MLDIYFVRHGATCETPSGRYAGLRDVALSERGLDMAQHLAHRLASVAWQRLYTSPLQRTRQTVAPVAAAAGLTPHTDPDLAEIAYGAWDGLTPDEVATRFPAQYASWLQDPARHPPPGGETITEVATRARRSLDNIIAAHPQGSVLVVSHKTTLRVLLCVILGIDPRHYKRRFAMPLGGVSVVRFSAQGPQLLRFADTDYLPPHLHGAADTQPTTGAPR